MNNARTDARAAYNNGDKIFRYMEVISTVVGDVVGMAGAIVKDDSGGVSGDILGLKGVDNQNRQIWSVVEVIEEEGWTMCHADHVFQQTHSKSRDKFLSSGQQQAVSGKLVGIYTFRRREDAETT